MISAKATIVGTEVLRRLCDLRFELAACSIIELQTLGAALGYVEPLSTVRYLDDSKSAPQLWLSLLDGTSSRTERYTINLMQSDEARAGKLIAACVLAMLSCAHRRIEVSCRTADESSGPHPARPLADLTAARAYYHYIAVTNVEPAGEHFTVWYHHIEPVFERLRVERNPAGLTIFSEGGMFGGIGGPPPTAPVPADVLRLALDLESILRKRCPAARDWALRYGGRNRTVTVQEFIPHDQDRRSTRRGGWKGEAVAMPTGLVLPGASSPSPEAEALRIKLDGPLEARMDVSLFDDPRTH